MINNQEPVKLQNHEWFTQAFAPVRTPQTIRLPPSREKHLGWVFARLVTELLVSI